MTEVTGTNSSGNGVSGTGSGYGVLGVSTGAFAGVVGQTTTAAPGVYGQSSSNGPGILGISGLGELVNAVFGETPDEVAVNAAARYPDVAGIFVGPVAVTGQVTAQSLSLAENAAVAGDATVTGSLTAGPAHLGTVGAKSLDVSGNATVTGALHAGTSKLGAVTAASLTTTGVVSASDVVLTGADCAEEFDCLDGPVEPGSVVELADDGSLRQSSEPYSKRVAGVVSGAGDYRPGVVLDRRPDGRDRVPIALVGKVYCKVDATEYPVEVGDLLTTSAIAGHAMKATDAGRAFGAVIGKALSPLSGGSGLIPVLVGLG
jgi:hypothetical protein